MSSLPLTLTTATDPDSGGVVVSVAGELDLATFAVLDEQHRVHTRASTPMRIDLGAVDFIDSAGLAALLLARRRAEEHGVPLTFDPVSDRVGAAFRLAGVHDWLTGGPEAPVARIEWGVAPPHSAP